MTNVHAVLPRSVLLLLTFAGVVSAQGVCNSFQAVPERCDLNAAPVEQAKCLLRPVKKFAHLGEPLRELPAPLDSLIGRPTEFSITLQQLKHFLAEPQYFVIHDTSDLLPATEFPANINRPNWSLNKLSSRVGTKICHVYINRVGQSATAVVFESPRPPSGTKLGRCNRVPKTAFIHIENIQPRIRDRSVTFPNDALAPVPGFSDAQLERLALVYVVASVRSGKWLIPAYHSPLDLGFPGRHDDPQNFDLQAWATKLQTLIGVLRSIH